MTELLKGAYDLHVHSAPDVLPRKMNDLEMAERIIKSGMKGYAIKSHYFCTSERAQIVNTLYPEVEAIGTICLNGSVGGINPAAVEMAGRSGAKLVWMPSVDAANEQAHLNAGKAKTLPYWAKIMYEMREDGIEQTPIYILTEDGDLKEEMIAVLKTIAKYNMILATGHLGWQEIKVLVKKAKELGVKKILITHATFPSTFLTIEQQKEMIGQGAYIEHCFTTPNTGKVEWNVVIEQIRAIGPENCILATDLGQPHGVYPDEGLALFAEKLLANGFTKDEIITMVRTNPEFLVK